MSGSNNEQNGRQPPLPNHPPPSSDLRTGINVPDQPKAICRKYVWGTCSKGTHCKFRHELDFEEMKKILKFCHDYQNKQGCGRIDCTYLHASKEEVNLFLSTGQLPRVLAERYATMSEPSNSMHPFESVPQMMFVAAPPPPPPPPAPVRAVAAAPPPPPPPQQGPAFASIQQPPPPPPPPTVPPTPVVQTPPMFTGPPPSTVLFPLNQPPPTLPPMFDASRPPPPIPGQTKNGALKRRLECEAGPSKVRKPEGPKAAENGCENCVQRELRLDAYKEELDKIHCELKYQSLVYKKKLKELDHGKEILRALVSPELYRILDEYIEGGPPQMQDILAQFTQNPLISLVEYLCSNTRNVVDSALSPSLRLDDTLPSLSSLSRIANPVNHSSTDLLHTLFEVLRNSNSERESRSEADGRTNTSSSSNVNGYNRLTNGQKSESSTPASTSAGRYSTATSTVTRTYPAAAAVAVAGPSGVTANAAPVPAPAPPAPVYPAYHPGVPPPINRPYTQPSYTVVPPNAPMLNMAYTSPSRVGPPPPVTQQMPIRPSASSVAPPLPPPNYNQFMMGRYPHPPQYYPPYQ